MATTVGMASAALGRAAVVVAASLREVLEWHLCLLPLGMASAALGRAAVAVAESLRKMLEGHRGLLAVARAAGLSPLKIQELALRGPLRA